jgi:transposase-like protein
VIKAKSIAASVMYLNFANGISTPLLNRQLAHFHFNVAPRHQAFPLLAASVYPSLKLIACTIHIARIKLFK